MYCVNNLWINTTWLIAKRPMEMHINGSIGEVIALSASNLEKQISFGLERDENLLDFGPNDSTWIGLNQSTTENGRILDIGWKLPYNLHFDSKDEWDTFLAALEAKVHDLCSYMVIEGDLSFEESIGYVLEKDANEVFNEGRRVKQDLIEPVFRWEYKVFRLERNGIKVLEIWKWWPDCDESDWESGVDEMNELDPVEIGSHGCQQEVASENSALEIVQDDQYMESLLAYVDQVVPSPMGEDSDDVDDINDLD
ncbi:hypothetical protein PMI08_01088 [Brevibacillus sp. CF112]|uniref:hypothetical protein n=1 Tax=Brevibacillus TaxID=55080 RepID=UPI000271656B|nr:hypothetical protein [Brevibacillus sp. CF112]EJL46593.1 hypothetical protein PMI08_01088 [Brevibacillus sp. CF112]